MSSLVVLLGWQFVVALGCLFVAVCGRPPSFNESVYMYIGMCICICTYAGSQPKIEKRIVNWCLSLVVRVNDCMQVTRCLKNIMMRCSRLPRYLTHLHIKKKRMNSPFILGSLVMIFTKFVYQKYEKVSKPP